MQKEHMTYSLPKRAALPLLAMAALLASGCASVAVSNDAIEQNTAQALGLAKGTFTISDRVDDGVKASYSVKTNTAIAAEQGCNPATVSKWRHRFAQDRLMMLTLPGHARRCSR